MKHVGYLFCATCGFQHITDPKKIVIWYSLDSDKQLGEAECPSCRETIQSDLDLEDVGALKGNGVEVKELGKKFEQLTEEEIVEWDLDEEFQNEFTD